MDKNLKIMIAYDGSDNSEIAIDDLQLAGLPRVGNALVVSVEDSLTTAAVSDFDLVERAVSSRRILSTAALLKEKTLEAMKDLMISVNEAVENVSLYLPEWAVEGKILTGSPAQTLLGEAKIQKPDLVVVGSHKRTAIGRFFLGSVSLELAEKLDCSVRVVYTEQNEQFLTQPRLIVPIEDSDEIELLIRHIGSRVWSSDTKIRFVVTKKENSTSKDSKVLSQKQLKLEWAIEQMEAIGLNVSVEFSPNYLTNALLESSTEWNATSIFISSLRSERNGGKQLDEVVTNLLTKANCTVEIVR